MAFFSLLWKARTIEKYRLEYENEKIKSILSSDIELPKNNFMQKCRHFHYDTKKQMKKKFRQWCPEGSAVSNFLIYVRMDQTFPNFLVKSLLGFVGGIILTYLCFMFFVFQLSISLIHATIMSSVIGILLTLGLAFSYRIRCLVFLLIPQFFSRVGRYTLTCYALVLILTGPATNTLKNSEVLSESMACGQEQIKASVRQLNDSYKNPLNLVKDSITTMVERIKQISGRLREMLLRLNRLMLSLVSIFQSVYSWLLSLVPFCNEQFGSPYERCVHAISKGYNDYTKNLKTHFEVDAKNLIELVCWTVKPYDAICIPQDYINRNIATVVKKKLNTFSDQIKTMLYVDVHVHHTYSYNNNVSKTASQAAAGIVTEIRNRADPMLTWLSWSSCVTSLFLLLIIFRAKYYQHMYETRSRFDNRYLTKELRELDFKRQKQGKHTILPLNRRERMKYICASSFQLVPSEKVYLSRSTVFMTITTFKLLIHVVADYSLYWILMTIRYHGRFQTPIRSGYPESGVKINGSGPVARFLQSIFDAIHIPLNTPSPMPVACLPDPIPPDMHRYTQIGVLIFLLWFFALFEPYGLRLRHVIMGMYNPDRAKARAAWLYNHILTTRAGFMKYARRKLHRQYKYSSEKRFTFKCLLNSFLKFRWLQAFFGTGPDKQKCLLCSTKEIRKDPDTELISCENKGCPGVFCVSCFGDIGQLCTICLSPADYGDISDISLELGSSDESEDDNTLDDDDDSDDEKRCLLRRPTLKRKLSHSNNNTSKRVQNYEMHELSSQKKANSDEDTQQTNFYEHKELFAFSLNVHCSIQSSKVDCNNNVLEYFIQKENKRIKEKNNEYLNFSADFNANAIFSYESMSLVFILTQEINDSKLSCGGNFFKFGCCHEILIKKRNVNNNKRSRDSLNIQCSSITNLLQNIKALFQSIQPSYYCLNKSKKRLIVRKIVHKVHTGKLKRNTTYIKIVKKHDNIMKNYFKNLRALKVKSKLKRINKKRLPHKSHEEINEEVRVDFSLQDGLNTVDIINSEHVTKKCGGAIEDKTAISNWMNKEPKKNNLALRENKIKKEKNVSWEPLHVIDVTDESYYNEVSNIRKSSQATQIPSDNQYLEDEDVNYNVLPINSKSSRAKDRKKLRTCTCATQYSRVAVKTASVERDKRDHVNERHVKYQHKRREHSNIERQCIFEKEKNAIRKTKDLSNEKRVLRHQYKPHEHSNTERHKREKDAIRKVKEHNIDHLPAKEVNPNYRKQIVQKERL